MHLHLQLMHFFFTAHQVSSNACMRVRAHSHKHTFSSVIRAHKGHPLEEEPQLDHLFNVSSLRVSSPEHAFSEGRGNYNAIDMTCNAAY